MFTFLGCRTCFYRSRHVSVNVSFHVWAVYFDVSTEQLEITGGVQYTGLCSIIHDHLSHSAVCSNWLRPLSVLHRPGWHQLLLGPGLLFISADCRILTACPTYYWNHKKLQYVHKIILNKSSKWLLTFHARGDQDAHKEGVFQVQTLSLVLTFTLPQLCSFEQRPAIQLKLFG